MKINPAKKRETIAILVSVVGSEVNDKSPANPILIITIPMMIKEMEISACTMIDLK